MTPDDMAASNVRIKDVATVETISQYGQRVMADIDAFLKSGNDPSFDRVVPAHYGGEVTVVELLNIILSHSTHHLKQMYWHMEEGLGIVPLNPVTEEQTEGIVTPEALI